jgi:hypothetical protein
MLWVHWPAVLANVVGVALALLLLLGAAMVVLTQGL